MHQDTLRLLQPYLGRTDLAEAFLEQPLGPYPDELLHMLTLLRGVPPEGKYVLIELDPGKSWILGSLSGKRGVPLRVMSEFRFDDLAQAERTIFRLRWAWWTGEELTA